MAENARHDAIADGRLIVAPAAAGADEKRAQAAQGRRLVLVAPQRVERGIIMLERRAERFDRQREDFFDQANAAARRQCRVGDAAPRRMASR